MSKDISINFTNLKHIEVACEDFIALLRNQISSNRIKMSELLLFGWRGISADKYKEFFEQIANSLERTIFLIDKYKNAITEKTNEGIGITGEDRSVLGVFGASSAAPGEILEYDSGAENSAQAWYQSFDSTVYTSTEVLVSARQSALNLSSDYGIGAVDNINNQIEELRRTMANFKQIYMDFANRIINYDNEYSAKVYQDVNYAANVNNKNSKDLNYKTYMGNFLTFRITVDGKAILFEGQRYIISAPSADFEQWTNVKSIINTNINWNLFGSLGNTELEGTDDYYGGISKANMRIVNLSNMATAVVSVLNEILANVQVTEVYIDLVTNGEKNAAIIKLGSSDMRKDFETGYISMSSTFSGNNNTSGWVYASDASQTMLDRLTGRTSDDSKTYNTTMVWDKNHKTDSHFAYIAYNAEQEPTLNFVIYDDDKFNIESYDFLIFNAKTELDLIPYLKEPMNLDAGFADLLEETLRNGG